MTLNILHFFNKGNYFIKFHNYLCGFGNYFNKNQTF